MYLGTSQIIWVVIAFLALGIDMAKHGERKEGQHNFWVTLISTGISFIILYSGGFFTR